MYLKPNGQLLKRYKPSREPHLSLAVIQAPQIVNAAQKASGKEANAQIAVTQAIFSYSEAPLGEPRLLLINAILHAPLLAISKERSFGRHYSTYCSRPNA